MKLTDLQKIRLLLLAVFVIITAITDIRYETNDDFGMMSIVSGLYTGSPSEYVIFQNILMGIYYKTLYTLFPGYNWYAGTLLLIQSLAFYAIFLSLNSLLVRSISKWVVLFTVFLFYTDFTLFLQFTKVAFIASFAGILLLLTRQNMLLGWVLSTLGILIRAKAFYGAFIFALPLFIYWAYFRKNRWDLSARQLAAFAATGVFALSAAWFNTYYYHTTKEWAEYYEFNQVRGAVHDRTAYQNNTDAVNKIAAQHGLSPNDTKLLFQWMFSDKTVYTKELMQDISDNVDKYQSEPLGSIFQHYLHSLTKYASTYIFILLPFLLWDTTKEGFRLKTPSLRPHIVLITAGMIVFYLALFYLLFLQHLSRRLVSPLILEVFIITVLLTANKINSKPMADTRRYLPLLLVLLIFSSNFVIHMHKWRKNYFSAEMISLLSPPKANRLVVMTEPLNFLGHVPVFGPNIYKVFDHNDYYLIGWREQSPLSQSILSRYNAADMFDLILKNPNAMLYSTPPTLNLLQQYILEHYHTRVFFKEITLGYYQVSFLEDEE